MAGWKHQICVFVGLLIGALATSPIWAEDAGPSPGARSDGPQGSVDRGEVDALFEGSPVLDRERLVRAVEDRNPTLRSARSALEAARARPSQAYSLADPMVSYTFAPLGVAADAVRFGQVLRFSQRLPYPGKRRLRQELAEAEAHAVAQDVDAVRLHLATAASLVFDDYYVVHRAIEINEEHVELLAMFQRIATARYAAGEAPQQAPLQAEVEAAHLLHRRVVLGTELAVLETKINQLLHREPRAYIPPPPAQLREHNQGDDSRGDRIEQALATRPEVGAARAELAARRLEVELARMESKPDFELLGSYNSMWSQSQHRLTVGAGIRLPLYRSRRRAAEAEHEAMAVATEYEITEWIDRIRTEVTTAELRLEEAKHVVALYGSRLLPATSDQVSAALAGFRTGQSSFLALIEAERNQRTVKLHYEQALADVHRRRAELDRALGRIPGRDDVTDSPAEGHER